MKSLFPLIWKLIKACCCSVVQLRLTLCDHMNCNTPGLPVLHHLLEFAQVLVHCICDAIQPCHPLMPSFPSALDLSQHQGLFQWVGLVSEWVKSLSRVWLFATPWTVAPLAPPSMGFSRQECWSGWDDQNTGVSSLASVLPVNVQGWSPLRLTGLISLMSKGLSGVFSSTTVQRHQGGTCIILPRNLCIFHNPLQDWGTLGDPEGYISNG